VKPARHVPATVRAKALKTLLGKQTCYLRSLTPNPVDETTSYQYYENNRNWYTDSDGRQTIRSGNLCR
jgi:hypothetical protein